jgi:hypothetical protein
MTPLEMQTSTLGLIPEVRSNQNGRQVVVVGGQLYNNFSVPNRGGDFLGESLNPWTGAPLGWLRTTVPQSLNTASMTAVLESLKRKQDAPASGLLGEWARGVVYGIRSNGVGGG